MKKLLNKMSRRERLMLIVGGSVLLFGIVVYPAQKRARSYRESQLVELSSYLDRLDGNYAVMADGDSYKEENELMRELLKATDDLLFASQSPATLQTKLVKLLNEMGPDLELDVTAGRASAADPSGRLNLNVKGKGRYPQILNFMRKLEEHRPLITIDAFQMSGGSNKKKKKGPQKKKSSKKTVSNQPSPEPTISMRLSIHVTMRGEGAES